MKNTLIILAIIISTTAIAGSEKAYIKAMKTGIIQLNEAKTSEQFDAVANKFIRIGGTEKDKWLPYYYSSLAYARKSFVLKELEEKDENLIESLKYMNKAKSLEENNAEVIALEGLIYMLQLSASPAERGQAMTPKTFGAFNTALGIEPANPRALLLKGQMQYGMSQFFGSGAEEACAMILKSIELFENAEVDEDSILPDWGLASARQNVENCKPKDDDNQE